MSIITKVSNVGGRLGLKVRAASPEILIGVGIVGVVTSAVMASKATLKVDDILNESKAKLADIEKVLSDPFDKYLPEGAEYTEKDAKKDKALVVAQTGLSLAKLYGPSIIVGGLSIAALIGSHRILKGRNVALMGAYKVLDSGYKKYRERVIEKLGEEADRAFKNGVTDKISKMKVLDDKGKEVTEEVVNTEVDPGDISTYARFFDSSSRNWQPDSGYNLMFLRAQQNYANDLLVSRGHLFLNEVYDMLGIDRTPEGAVVGWVYDSEDGDSYVDFDMYNYDKDLDVSEQRRAFVNGNESVILLDFNVDGVIYNLI